MVEAAGVEPTAVLNMFSSKFNKEISNHVKN
jgi:hypothetical protein